MFGLILYLSNKFEAYLKCYLMLDKDYLSNNTVKVKMFQVTSITICLEEWIQ